MIQDSAEPNKLQNYMNPDTVYLKISQIHESYLKFSFQLNIFLPVVLCYFKRVKSVAECFENILSFHRLLNIQRRKNNYSLILTQI